MLAIDQSTKNRAKKEKIYLWQIKIDGRFAGKSIEEFSGALPNECANELFDLIEKWIEDGKI